MPPRGDNEVYWQSMYWQPLCDWHHKVVKPKLEYMYQDGHIPPGELWANSRTAIKLTNKLIDQPLYGDWIKGA